MYIRVIWSCKQLNLRKTKMEDETLTAKAEKFKNKGNDEFKLGNYQNAIKYYSDAIGMIIKSQIYYLRII